MKIEDAIKDKSKGELGAIVAEIIAKQFGIDGGKLTPEGWGSPIETKVATMKILRDNGLAPSFVQEPPALDPSVYSEHPFENNGELLEIFEIARSALEAESNVRADILDTTDLSEEYLDGLRQRLHDYGEANCG